MRSLCAASVVVISCTAVEDPPFDDRGRGVWRSLPDVPVLTYRAIAGAGPDEVFAAGDGGIAQLDGATWRLVDGVPSTTYRAVWARSPSEVWIGGDGALLARSPSGWQPQALFDGPHEITDYSVLALAGNAAHEYAIASTGGKLLLLRNRGSTWETLPWRGGTGPLPPIPQQPSLVVDGASLVAAGDSGVVRYVTATDLGVALWEGARLDLPPSVIAGGPDFWVAASAGDVAVQRETGALDIVHHASGSRDVRAVAATRANRFFVLGDPGSTIEACDATACTREPVEAPAATLRALWSDDATGVTLAAGDGVIVERRACGQHRCTTR